MDARQIKNYTQLAKCLDISKNQLSNILSDKFNPIKSNVVELADFFGLDPLELISKNTDKMETIYHYGEENIFDILDGLSVGNNYTTVGAYIENNQISTTELKRLKSFNENDFFEISTKKVLNEEELFRKYNIVKK